MRLALAALPLAIALSVPLVVAQTCTPLAGHFVATAEIPCLAAPGGICTHGQLTGDLDGRYEFVMTSQSAGSDLSRPLLLSFTGASQILLADGVMLAEDDGEMEVNPVGPWPFKTVVNIHSGDGAWTGATGQLVAIGALDTQAGVTEGDYTGFVCF